MKKSFVLIFAFIFGLTATAVLAAGLQNAFPIGGNNAGSGTNDILGPTANGAGYNLASNTIEPLVGTIVTVILSLLGVIFFILMIYAGWLYMSSQGDDKKVNYAKQMIYAAIIGVVIIIAAYAITAFVGGRLGGASLK